MSVPFRDEHGRFLPGNPSRFIPRYVPKPGSLKRCTSCGDKWPIECFTLDPTAPDGHERRCKACRYERRAELGGGKSKTR